MGGAPSFPFVLGPVLRLRLRLRLRLLVLFDFLFFFLLLVGVSIGEGDGGGVVSISTGESSGGHNKSLRESVNEGLSDGDWDGKADGEADGESLGKVEGVDDTSFKVTTTSVQSISSPFPCFRPLFLDLGALAGTESSGFLSITIALLGTTQPVSLSLPLPLDLDLEGDGAGLLYFRCLLLLRFPVAFTFIVSQFTMSNPP